MCFSNGLYLGAKTCSDILCNTLLPAVCVLFFSCFNMTVPRSQNEEMVSSVVSQTLSPSVRLNVTNDVATEWEEILAAKLQNMVESLKLEERRLLKQKIDDFLCCVNV